MAAIRRSSTAPPPLHLICSPSSGSVLLAEEDPHRAMATVIAGMLLASSGADAALVGPQGGPTPELARSAIRRLQQPAPRTVH
jgi:hypothetical protein